jgi:hypothetical protein
MSMQELRKDVLPALLRTAEAIDAELGAAASPSARRTSLDSESARVESGVR